ncbi:MAG: TIGR02391 family protein [Candidatus Aenigmatarchaeota archaeon]|nr:MAG: TIGR02391 family protein [Candidatus Aenigmarchaeota archaeon]
MFGKSRRQKILKLRLGLLHKQILNPYDEIMKALSHICDLLRDNQFPKARAYITTIYSFNDLLQKQIKMYITREVKSIFETGAELSCSFEDIEKKEKKVFKWIDEVNQKAKELQDSLKITGDMREIDHKEVFRAFYELLDKISYDRRFIDFVNSLRMLVVEFEIRRLTEPSDRLSFLFDELKLHPIIRKSSRKLFRDGHYAQAILEAYKALNKYVKQKSKLKDLDGKDLMSKAFGFDYDRMSRTIKRRPMLQLNELLDRSDRDEQEGFMLIFMGVMQGIRNPKAHEIIKQKDPFKTLEYLSLASLLARKVDEAKLTSG